MKNIKLFVSYLLLAIFLSGCVSQPTPERTVPEPVETQTPQPTSTPTPTPQPVLIGSAETKLLDKTENRLHNIAKSIETIDGCTLAPGEKFSFNGRVGARTKERGYRKATVLIKLEKVQDYGGGVCQVSSTLFQAVKSANLSVTERHSHQKDVGYATQGNDAAVDYGHKDMCFINSKDFSVVIKMQLLDNSVRAEVYQLP